MWLYCKQCGTKNEKDALYCVNDGFQLVSSADDTFVEKESVKYCRNCSHESTAGALYCSDCGISLEKVVKKQSSNEFTITPKQSKQKGKNEVDLGEAEVSPFTKEGLIRSLKSSAIVIAILLVISFITSSILNSYLRSTLEEEFFFLAPVISSLKVVSMTDIFMIFHLASINYSAQIPGMEFFIRTSGGLIVFLILPVIIFMLTGFLMNRKQRERNMINRLKGNLSFSVVYAIIVGVISLFSGVSLNLEAMGGFGESVSISSQYQFFNVLFNAFVINFILVSFGSMIGLTKENKQINHHYGISIQRALKTFMLGIIACGIIGIAVLSTDAQTEGAEIPVIMQGYLWNIAQFGTLSLDMTTPYEDVQASYSILGGPKASLDEAEFKAMIKELTGSFFWLIGLVPMLLHFWTGNQLRKATTGNILYELGVYAGAFGLLNAVFVSISQLSINTNIEDVFAVSFGFSVIEAFFTGAIMAFVIAYIAVMVTNRNAQPIHEDSEVA